MSSGIAIPDRAQFDDETGTGNHEEALKYEGGRMCTGADSLHFPLNVRDWCSGAMARLNRPALATDSTGTCTMYASHIPLSEAKQGIWSLLHSAYNAGTYITHVGTVCGK